MEMQLQYAQSVVATMPTDGCCSDFTTVQQLSQSTEMTIRGAHSRRKPSDASFVHALALTSTPLRCNAGKTPVCG